MPPGQQPPQIVQYDASSVPILQIALGSDTLSEQQLYDQGLWLVRNEVVPVPGATVPLPYGGRPRLVMIDADPVRMHAKGITVKDINDAPQQAERKPADRQHADRLARLHPEHQQQPGKDQRTGLLP
jgi:multidrug efflux pump subunit AcrB